MKIIIYIILFLSVNFLAMASYEEDGILIARISRINDRAELIRLRIESKNAKFYSKGDVIEIWSDSGDGKNRCKGKLIGKSIRHLLLKSMNLKMCMNKLALTVGGRVKTYSKDFKKSLKQAQDLFEVMQKKRIAVRLKLNREQQELESYLEKVESINTRYEVLTEKLQQDWKEELRRLENDKIESLRRFKEYEAIMTDLDHKAEKYRIYEEIMEDDRWSLDKKIFSKK